MRVRYTETAQRELDDILAYIADRNFSAVSKLARRVEILLGRLAEFPYMAQVTEAGGVRRLPLVQFPYVIFYIVHEDEIVILHVRHSARRPLWTNE
jgi:plasmid stabilization system protein ParE